MNVENTHSYEIDQSIQFFPHFKGESLDTFTTASVAVLGGVAMLAVEAGASIASNTQSQLRKVGQKLGSIVSQFASSVGRNQGAESGIYIPNENGNGYVVDHAHVEQLNIRLSGEEA
jgi:hypothetical protein